MRHFDLLWEKLLKFYGDTPYVFFDEIQNIKKWDLFLNRLQRLGYNIWITGSNANLLSKELSTYLTGRCIEFELYPFSFREYLTFQGINSILYSKKGTKGRSEVGRAFDSYFIQGGFPEVLKIKDWKPYLRGLFSQIITRDIAQRYPRTEIFMLNDFAIRTINYAGCRMSFQELSRQIEGSSAATFIRYMKYLESVYLCFSVPNFNIKKKTIDKVPKKLFALDLGLIETLSTKMTQDFGLKLENLVFIELKRRKLDVFSWKGYHGEEIDFLIYENRKVKELMQVCWDLSDPKTLQRELHAFELAYREFGHHQPQLILLTYEQDGQWEIPFTFNNQSKKLQIKAIPIVDWLLE
jgi:predicted AAA+ superfamily ATPase